MGQWVVLELNSRGEQEDPDLVRGSIAHTLKAAEVFLPAVVTQVGDDRVIHYLVDGYAFVKFDRQPVDYFRLEGSKYIQSILVKPGAGSRHRRVSTVDDRDILRMQDQIKQLVDQGIGIGDVVKITSGPYRNMQATVVEEIPETRSVQVHIRLRSKQSLVTLPRSFLIIVERAPFSAISNRLSALAEWTTLSHPILQWDADPGHLWNTYKELHQVEYWRRKGERLFTVVSFGYVGFDRELETVRKKAAELEKVSRWYQRANQLFNFIVGCHDQGPLKPGILDGIQSKYLELLYIDDLLERIRMLWEEVDIISRDAARKQEGKSMVQNVLVDGHNLAFRCLYAPGMQNLIDSKGRPTGLILGFLRSLGSLKKRYPDAVIHVVWDGSSQRRKRKFGEYKANRTPTAMAKEAPSGIRFDPVLFLRELIPLFGIRQAWNPEEEADDVIATLVRGELSKQNNVIFSTDKDLLQLVTQSTSQLVPAVGSRNEILFDPITVLKTIGVSPEKMIQLRSLYGDSSDNIPGVPRVPKKVLRSLIQAHGSINGLYQSGLAGLSKGQYERLRAAEPQVRINVELMTLVDVGVTTTPPDVDPDNVAERLRELEINPDSLLDTFFGSGRRS